MSSLMQMGRSIIGCKMPGALWIAAFLSFMATSAAAETYNECILENMKGVGGDVAARLVHKACRDKVLPYVPAACKKIVMPQRSIESDKKTSGRDALDNWLDAVGPVLAEECVQKCLNASYLSKTFGDCKP